MTEFFSTNTFDLAVYVCLFVAVVMGFMTGLLRSLATIFGYICGIGIAVAATPKAVSLLATYPKFPTPHLSAPQSNDNGFVEKCEHDELVILAINDPLMTAAVHNARQTLPQFLALAKQPGPNMVGFAVKIAILAKNGVEFFWIHPFAHVDDRFIGQINNTPRSVVNLKMGDTVTFVKNEIVDWMYIDGGTMKGIYSARAILRSAKPKDRKAFMRRFGLDFES